MPVRLVLGLGNPGARFAATRHNIGFEVVDAVARRSGAHWRGASLWALAAAPSVDPLWLAKPLAYMNRSGEAAELILDHVGATVAHLLVVVDDVDLSLGRLRLKATGGPGTHNGLRDLCDRLGRDFARLRVGVRGEQPWDDLAEYVLSPFAADEEPAVTDAVERAADAVESVWRDGFDAAMARFNRWPLDD